MRGNDDDAPIFAMHDVSISMMHDLEIMTKIIERTVEISHD